jgi:hypothetical protein
MTFRVSDGRPPDLLPWFGSLRRPFEPNVDELILVAIVMPNLTPDSSPFCHKLSRLSTAFVTLMPVLLVSTRREEVIGRSGRWLVSTRVEKLR